jgi:hypothetical protein
MRKGMAYLDAAEKCRHLARQTTERQIKKQLEAMAVEWEALAAERAKQLSKRSTASADVLTSRPPSRRSGEGSLRKLPSQARVDVSAC